MSMHNCLHLPNKSKEALGPVGSRLTGDRDTEKNLSSEQGCFIFFKYIFSDFKIFIFNKVTHLAKNY